MISHSTQPATRLHSTMTAERADSHSLSHERSRLRTLFDANRAQMMLTYTLLCVENLLRMLQPFVLGIAINDLLNQSTRGLFLFIGQHLAYVLMGTARQFHDTRVFSGIYTGLATDLVVGQRRQQVDVSRVAARSTLSRAYVDFFEVHLPMMIRSGWSVFGALAMLAVYDWRLIGWCIALILPASLLNAYYSRHTRMLSRGLHDQLEGEVTTIRAADPDAVRQHFHALADWKIRLSDAEAINFSLMELFIMGLMIATLAVYCSSGAVTPGDVFSVFRYVMLFVMGLDSVPKIVEHLSRLKDIDTRLRPPN